MPGKPNDVTVTFEIKDLSTDLIMLGFRGEEGISRLFRFDIDLAVDKDEAVDFSKVLGKAAHLTLKNETGKRYFHGMVCRFQQTQQDRNWLIYSLTLVPRAWRMQHRKDSRIFGKLRMDEVVKKVLDKPHKVKFQFRHKGNKKPHKREYCVQYRETDWNFVTRLLEEEGYHYYFEHKENEHTLHISNDATYHPTIAGSSSTLTYMPPGAAASNEHVFRLTYEERVRSGKVMLNDFTFLNTALDNKDDDEEKLDTDLEVYDYPALLPFPEEEEKGGGEVDVKKKHAATMPVMRLQAIQAGRAVAQGGSDCIRFTSGYAFSLGSENLHGALKSGEYLLTQVAHVGQKHGDLEAGAVSRRVRYSNNFTIIPKLTPFRPPRMAPKPFVQGSQTATVVGTAGSSDDIVTDKHGRVKVQFHWDRRKKKDTKSEQRSRWVRVSQLWAGKGWGAMFIPRVGHEVIVDFMEGDPDRPVITGRLYNGQNTPPYTLPLHRTKSTIKSDSSIGGGGSNELMFEDKKNSEQIYIHAEKDQVQVIENNHTLTVYNSQTRTIHNQRTTKIEKKNDKLDVETGRQDVTIKSGADLTVQNGNRKVDVTCGDYTVAVHGGNIAGVASEGVSLHGESKGVMIKGDGKGVGIKGTGKGVAIDGKGGSGITMESDNYIYGHATHAVELLADTQASLIAPANIVQGDNTMDVNGKVITVDGGTTVTVKVGGSSIKVDAAGVTITTGAVVSVTGTTIKLNC